MYISQVVSLEISRPNHAPTKQVARSNKSGRTVLGVTLRTPWMFSFELSLWYLYWLWLWLMMWRWVSCLHAVLVWNRNVEQTHKYTRHTAERERCCWSMTGLETRYPAWVSWVQWWSVGDSECKLTCWENDLLIDYCARVMRGDDAVRNRFRDFYEEVLIVEHSKIILRKNPILGRSKYVLVNQ